MSYTIRTRAQIGLDPVVRNANGSPRPKLTFPLGFVIYHYTGVNVNWGDVGDTDAEILGIERWAASVGKPNEYNVVIHQDPDDLVHEYAGPFRAAHSSGENGNGLGVLLLNGINEPLTALQLDKMKWVNQFNRDLGLTNHATRFIGHRDAPGAATACPGPHIMPKLWFVNEPPTFPLQTPAPPPTPEPKPPVPVQPPDSTGVGHYLITEGRTAWGISAEVYGTGTRWPEIVEANLPDTTPNPGERWKVPGFTGKFTEVRDGEGPWAILDRLFGRGGWNTSTGVDEFWQWNGGVHVLQPGEQVWVRH